MIKFFRKIRKQLADDNKPVKYFRYAIGEIVLVVIGILIALSINNWNEDRKFRELEQVYLERLLHDLEQDTIEISILCKRAKKKQQIIESLTKKLESNTDLETLFPYVNAFLREGTIFLDFSANLNTYSDLSQTGNMNVIRNNDLSSLIKGYYLDIDDFHKYQQINKDWVIPMDVNFSQATAMFELDPRTKGLFNKENKALAMQNLIEHKDLFMRNAAGHYWFNASFMNLILVLKRKAAHVILILQKELKE